MAWLEVKDLSVAFGGVKVVDGVSFSVERGERFGIIGESGAGKTMMALAITGLLPEGARVTGTISIDGAPLPTNERALARFRGRHIGMVFQEPMSALNPLMTAGAQIAEVITINGGDNDIGKQVSALLVEVGLEARHARRYPHQLSGGQRQRVMIAMALAAKPELLIADEPTSALDLIVQRKVLDLIDHASATRNMTLLLISHDLKAVAALCAKVMVLKGGKSVEEGEKLAIFGRPQHAYTRMLIAASRHRTKTLMRTPIGEPLLEMRNLVRQFKQPDVSIFEPRPPLKAVNDVSFSIRQGESLALVGPSGSGKSTLARIIAGLDNASSGQLEFDRQIYHGTDLPPRLRRDISLVFQDPFGSFNPRLTIGQSVAEPLRLEPQHSVRALSERLIEVVKAVGLSADMLGRYPHEFSGGQRQRFAIARALITRPRLVVLDEPVSALDVSVRGEILVLLNRLRADFGLTCLFISHDLEMVRVVADRVMVMDSGKIIETGTPAQLLDAPEAQITQDLVAARLPEIGIVPI